MIMCCFGAIINSIGINTGRVSVSIPGEYRYQYRTSIGVNTGRVSVSIPDEYRYQYRTNNAPFKCTDSKKLITNR
jgi:hypothetical protein